MNQENLDLVTRRIQSSMAQLVHVTDDGKIMPIASALLLEIGGELRLLSAGHAINTEDYEKILLPLPGFQEGLCIDTFGDLRTTNLKSDQENNEIDFAEITFRKKDIENKVKQSYSSLPESSIEFKHYPRKEDDSYFIFGYPASRARFNYQTRQEMNSEPLRIISHPIVEEDFYSRYGYSMSEHILLHIKRKIERGNERVFIPKTEGISGCGVYHIPHLNEAMPHDEFRLIGILTEVDFEKQYATIVRMDTIYRVLHPN